MFCDPMQAPKKKQRIKDVNWKAAILSCLHWLCHLFWSILLWKAVKVKKELAETAEAPIASFFCTTQDTRSL